MNNSIGVFVFIKDKNEKVLLVRDVTREQKWTLPGGGLELAEIVDEAAVREVKEEASLDIKIIRQLGIFSQTNSPGIIILFEGKVIGGELKVDGVETSDAKYFSFNELLEIENLIKPAQMSMIQQVMKAKDADFPIYNHFIKP